MSIRSVSLGKKMSWGVLTALVIVALLFIAGFEMLKHGGAWDFGKAVISASPEVQSRYGNLKSVELSIFNYNYSFKGGRKDAAFTAKVVGHKASGDIRLRIHAYSEEQWTVDSMIFVD